jgi:hypothetical protein
MKNLLLYLPKIMVLKKGSVFQEAYQSYVNDRGITDVSELAFLCLLKVYPALLVTSSDGFVDISEVDTLSSIAADGTSIPQEIFTRELKNLYLNQGHWRHLFINAIKELVQDEQLRMEVLMNMIYAAAASTGSIVKNILLSDYKPRSFSLNDIETIEQIDPTKQFFSEDEKQKIILISEELNLLQEESVRNKVYKIFG